MEHYTTRATILPKIVELIMNKYKLSENEALRAFYCSATGASFSDDDTGLYGQSPNFIFGLYELEMNSSGIILCVSKAIRLRQNYLKDNGVGEEQITTVDVEDGDFRNIRTSNELYEYVEGRLIKDKKNYVFLDEVQQVNDFQEGVDQIVACGDMGKQI